MKLKKALKISSIVAALGIFALSQQHALAQETAEQIQDYQVKIDMLKDGLIRVEENISYDFGANAVDRHGIFRDIPYKYKARGGTYKLRISDIKVTDENNTDYNFEKSTSGGELHLKIGDANTTVSGLKHYRIAYTVKRAINFFPDHDELYWNAIGTGWTVPILASGVEVKVPSATTNAQCYIGAVGTTETLCSILDNKTDTVTYSYNQTLEPGEGFTIVAGLPAGTITKPTAWQNALDILLDNGILALPLLVLGIMVYLWRKYGKDAKGKGTIVPQYEPPTELSPLYMGALVDGKVDNRDISAEIIYLAEQGYLKIERFETARFKLFKSQDYHFTKLKSAESSLMPQSKAVLEALFSGGDKVELSSFKKDTGWGKAITQIRSNIFKELTKSGYYLKNPNTMKGATLTAGIILAFAGSVVLSGLVGTLGVVAAILSGIIIVIFSFIMPALTAQGAEAKEYILGLKKYMTIAEKARLEFHNAPELNPKQFEVLLPFAIALGVEALWAKQFESIYQGNPSWYSDGTGANFNSILFASSLGDFSKSVQGVVASGVSSAAGGGSGFSGGGGGGGFGGGGGGSW